MFSDEALELGEEIIEMIDDEVPDSAKDRAGDFFEDVATRVRDVMETIERTGRVTPKQAEALENWRRGVAKWIH